MDCSQQGAGDNPCPSSAFHLGHTTPRESTGAVFQRLSSAPKKGEFTRGQCPVQESSRQGWSQVSGWVEPEHRPRPTPGRISWPQMNQGQRSFCLSHFQGGKVAKPYEVSKRGVETTGPWMWRGAIHILQSTEDMGVGEICTFQSKA